MTIKNVFHPNYSSLLDNDKNTLRPGLAGLHFMPDGSVIGTNAHTMYVCKGFFNNFPEGFMPTSEVVKLQKFINATLTKSLEDFTDVELIGGTNDVNILRIAGTNKTGRYSFECDFWPAAYMNTEIKRPDFYAVIPEDKNILAVEKNAFAIENIVNFSVFLKPVLKINKNAFLANTYFGPHRAVKMNWHDMYYNLEINSIVMPVMSNY